MAVGEILRTATRRPATTLEASRTMSATDSATDLGLDLDRYKLGWSDEEDYVFKPKKGLDERIIEEISWISGSPDEEIIEPITVHITCIV